MWRSKNRLPSGEAIPLAGRLAALADVFDRRSIRQLIRTAEILDNDRIRVDDGEPVAAGSVKYLHSMFLMRRQAKGLFTLDTKSGHPNHYLVCTVTGVAPYVSMARTLAWEAERGTLPGIRLVVLHAASRSWELAYHDELTHLAQTFPWIETSPW